MVKKYLKLENIKAYQIASELSDDIWNIVLKWDWFGKRTLGSQWVNATDSIAGNIAEGFGRYHKKDKKNFILTPEVLFMNLFIGLTRPLRENWLQIKK